MASRVVERAIYIEGSFDAVWTAVTEPEWHEDWNLAPCVSFAHRKGGSCAWGERGEPAITGTVEAFRPRAGELSHTFSFSFLAEPTSLVEWRMEPLGRVVAVHVRHTLSPGDEQTRQIVETGWTVALSRLKTLVESGKPMALPADEP